MRRETSSSFPGWVSNIEVFWEDPACARFLERLASFTRLILFDKRGTGLSDRVADLPNLETRMDDVRAVMDAVGSERAALFGYSEGGPMCALFAATYPARTTALIMSGGYARLKPAPDYPWGPTEEQARFIEPCRREWGGPVGLDIRAPAAAGGAASGVVVAAPADGREPGRGRGAPPDERRDGRPARAVCGPRARPSSSTAGRSRGRHRREPLHGRADPRRELVELTGERPRPVGRRTPTPSSTRSRSSSRVSGTAPSRTASWPRSSSPTSSAPPSERPPSGIAAGAISSRGTTSSSVASSAASAAARSTPPATGSWRPSTAPRGGSAAPAR